MIKNYFTGYIIGSGAASQNRSPVTLRLLSGYPERRPQEGNSGALYCIRSKYLSKAKNLLGHTLLAISESAFTLNLVGKQKIYWGVSFDLDRFACGSRISINTTSLIQKHITKQKIYWDVIQIWK